MALVNEQLLAILACPVCRGGIEERADLSALVCRSCLRAYPVRDGIPVMLAEEATTLAEEGGSGGRA